MSSLFESLRFRLHVRNLLYDYVKKHCNVDYLRFTECLVSEFFEDLQLVPLTDPYSLTLPVDPLDTLEKIYSNFPVYSPDDHDVLQGSQETVAFLREVYKARSGKCKTDKIVMSDSYGTQHPHEPVYAALTRRARQNTRVLGSGEVQQPCTLKKLFEDHKLAVLEVEKVGESKVDLEDTLNIKISINPGEQPVLKSLLQSTLDTLRPDKLYKNKHLDSTSLCSQFPAEPSWTAPEDVFMPVFPRRRHIGISTPTMGVELADFKSLIENASAPFEPVEVANLDEDIPRQNIVLVGGWEAIKSSPPSTPSSKASEIDELDDIRFPSSPTTTPPLMQEVEDSKMDQILIPRSRRIGGKGGITPHILRGKTLKTFLAPLLFQTQIERPDVPGAARVPSPTPSSLIGQPPSALGIDYETEANDYLDFDVDLEIQNVCEGYNLEPDFFLDETIDDKVALLMEVPSLPQPNEFPKDFYVPNSLSDLVIPSTAKGGQRNPNNDLPLYRFLKKVKGCQSLSLQLSWVPFTIDKQPPTMYEILDVVDLFLQETTDCKEALELLGHVAVEPSSSDDVSIRLGLEDGYEDLIYDAPTDEFRMMLNKKERSLLSIRHGSTSARATTTVDAGIHSDPSDVSADTDRPLKKPRLYDQGRLDGSPVENADCRSVEDQECGQAAGDDELVLFENENMIWEPYSTTFPHDDDLPTGDISVSSPCAYPDGTRHVELPAYTQPSSGDGVTTSGPPSDALLSDFHPSNKPEISRHSLGSFAFAQLRARKVSMPHFEPAPIENLVASPGTVERIDLPRGPPPEVCDANTIYLAEPTISQSIHRYLACLELIQRQALVRALCSLESSIELVERRDLGGVDLILDPETAVVFLNLFSLSVRCDACVDRIAKGSWKFDRILIIFEAYGELSAMKTKPYYHHHHPSATPVGLPYAYTPPVVKALKKFKRDLYIAEACGTKRTGTVVQYGFADKVEEAALLTRLYGDWCESNDRTHGAVWGKRDWLDADFLEDEEDNLSSLNGFNHFSASIILCQVSLEEFIDLLPEERVSTFGAYVLADHIRACNEDLDSRLEAMQTGTGTGI